MSGVDDPDNLQRFVVAQQPVYETVLAELRAGHKTGHWIWFIFPQLRGLGRSTTSEQFGIISLDEARAYLEHPVLGPRLRECSRLLTAVADRSIQTIVGWPDCLKVHSCMTLFSTASGSAADNSDFQAVLDKYYEGQPDEATLQMLTRG
ncbi:MAG: DUF1810 domain-containing protein [Mycobacterium sp.]